MDEKEKDKLTAEEEAAAEKNVTAPQKPEKEHIGGSIETDDYDILPEIEQDPAIEEELAGKEGIEVEYSFNGDDVREGLKTFQRAAIYRKNLIYTLILTAIFVLYVLSAVQDAGNILSSILSVLCVAVIAMLWYFPAQHVKKMAAAADTNSDTKFRMTVYDTCVRIAEQNGSFLLHYEGEITRTFETAHLFLVCVGKERIFILPKRYLADGEESQIRGMLVNGMGGRHSNQREGKGK